MSCRLRQSRIIRVRILLFYILANIGGEEVLTTTIGAEEIYLFHEGTNYASYRLLGAHLLRDPQGVEGVRFTVWAPHARAVGVAMDSNGWQGAEHPLSRIDNSGLWSGYIEGIGEGTLYKYEVIGADGQRLLKSDPYAFACEVRPNTASVVRSIDGYQWRDRSWVRKRKPPYDQPMNIYEVHLGTWKYNAEGKLLSYRELASLLLDYVVDMGYTHIELMPLTEHPYDLSWGYQVTGFFAATSRFGAPHELMHLIDECHLRGIGVILDWVPAHFAKDAHGLRQFDGQPLYEHEDPLIAEKPGWGTLGFDYSKPEVRSFLISNALFWMEMYHVDGLRVDAVTSMLLRDFEKTEWRPNAAGGREDLDAIGFLQQLNQVIFASFPHALMMAEESSAWPLVTAPTDQGGLGFNYKWNMGWMNDTLSYFELDPIHRAAKQSLLTFPIAYAFTDNYVLPLSHDEVVHGKKSLLNKMPGSYEQKFAGLRTLLAYWFSFPGKKLIFMGAEFGQFIEWKDQDQLDWLLLEYDMHRRMLDYTRTLNHLYLQEKSLWQLDHDYSGFEWIDHEDHIQNIIVYLRKGKRRGEQIVVVCNFAPVERAGYRIGVPTAGAYRELLNTGDAIYGGDSQTTETPHRTDKQPWHGCKHSLELTLPPLSVLWLKKEPTRRKSTVSALTKGEGSQNR
ncbi:1,4-alpha-glucan branching protein GlgB [Paenibacillus sp. 598K]|uniref:1,4-alpha-glucan branching protein GlgB n=1 Tax=Paenibacillus sp. 598K TaxID=1117987 RepID=UPI000FFE9CEC|nr:1,4-alpha-glucan branching protein GlgB [Paenibacillus sp. 598K]